jgi:hypothetical protein
MASRGRKRTPIAQDWGGHRPPVRRWLTPSHARGVEGVQIHWAPGPPRRMPRRGCRRSRRGCKPARRGVGLSGRTGPTQNWRRLDSSPREAPGSGRPCGTCVSARPSGRTGPPRAIGAALPQSNGWRRKHWRREKTSPGRGVRAAESRRGPLSPGAHVTGHVGRQGPSPHRRPVGEPGPGRVLCRPPGGDGAAAHPPAGAARAQHSQDGAEPTAARASGVCGPPPGDRPGLSGQDVSRGPHHE